MSGKLDGRVVMMPAFGLEGPKFDPRQYPITHSFHTITSGGTVTYKLMNFNLTVYLSVSLPIRLSN